MENQTTVSKFYLSGLSNLPKAQLPLFLLFLFFYLMTFSGNLLILYLIFTDGHLHTPMYFFLGNLACLDLCSSSTTVPRMLFDLLTKRRLISVAECITQFFFFLFFAISEVFLLAMMSYDRYIAVCHPLHYMQIMNQKVCVQLASGAGFLGLGCSLVQTLCLLRLTFCGPNILQSFFCDLPQLLQLSCTDTFINIMAIFLVGGLLGLATLVMTFFPYVSIFTTVFKIPAKDKRLKVFSTCTSHLTVVFIFYGTLVYNYFRPDTSYRFAQDRLVSVFYTVIIPLLNPLIYSLRNQELKSALKRAVRRIFVARR
ncbi:olfactory receptor 1019-like [Spea bombifrons]|uniref:olfactory receptor 1019-like n=1 Tax=Spea bombifrons TaxID=233779 RepID=UPI00234A6F8D|nr:olfactory receptor 1019-like [Spea bombifrons]